jgi:N-formylmaleamate deformylase
MSDWLSDYVMSNGIKIHYRRTGGDKPQVVLSHGFSDSGMCWIRVAKELENEFDLIMPDARGHGLSESPETGYDEQTRAADLAGLTKALKLDKPALMGHSMGASTTAMTAVLYPELARCIILEDPAWFNEGKMPNGRKAEMEKRRSEIFSYKSRTIEDIAESGRRISPSWEEIEFGPWAEAKKQLNPNVFDALGGSFTPWTEIVPKLKCPTLLVTGDPELFSIVTPETAREVSKVNPLIEVVQLKGAGHNIRRERFDGFIDAVRKFLKAH